MLLLTVYWKADLALLWPGAVRLKIIIIRAVIRSWNFADFDLYISGESGKLRNLGFRQCKDCKTIIIPLIPISFSSVSCCRRCLRCAHRCSFYSAVSCWRLLLRCSRWIWRRRSRSRGVSVKNLPGRGFGATCCACVCHNSANATRWLTQFARLLSQAHMLKINRDHRARLVSSNRENFAHRRYRPISTIRYFFFTRGTLGCLLGAGAKILKQLCRNMPCLFLYLYFGEKLKK